MHASTSGISLLPDKHPEVKKLMGPDPRLKYAISILVIVNVLSAYVVTHILQLNYFWTTVASYCFAGFINHCLLVGIHEVGHNLVFGHSRPLANRLFGIWANIPIVVPMATSFRKYHLEHHRYLATDGYDPDLPTDWEGWFFSNPLLKALWMFLYPVFYAIRPIVVRPLPVTKIELLNMIVQIMFNVALAYFWGFKALYYLLAAALLGMGLHPMSVHFIAEHFMFEHGYETYSYYGPWNILTWNIGYHVEHHDFPYIPCTNLPKVREMAHEFYDDLPQHQSWFGVMREFIFNSNLGPYSRVKREYDDVFGEKKANNPYLGVANVMKPVGFKDSGRKESPDHEQNVRMKRPESNRHYVVKRN